MKLMNKYEEYVSLLSKTYNEVVDYLLQKHGAAQDDYFREQSYQRFMNQEIKSVAKGKVSRTNEGLYCHHIDENKWLKMADLNFVRKYNIPFEAQKKERLVYCDLIEHSILHVLISKETNSEFGSPGYEAYLKPKIEKWYLDKIIPVSGWEKRCYNISFLDSQEAFNILREMEKVQEESYFNSLPDYYKVIEEKKGESEQLLKKIAQRRLDERNHWIKEAKMLDDNSSRKSIVNISYYIYIEYKNPADNLSRKEIMTFKKYDKEMKIYTKEKILEDLLSHLKNE